MEKERVEKEGGYLRLISIELDYQHVDMVENLKAKKRN